MTAPSALPREKYDQQPHSRVFRDGDQAFSIHRASASTTGKTDVIAQRASPPKARPLPIPNPTHKGERSGATFRPIFDVTTAQIPIGTQRSQHELRKQQLTLLEMSRRVVERIGERLLLSGDETSTNQPADSEYKAGHASGVIGLIWWPRVRMYRPPRDAR